MASKSKQKRMRAMTKKETATAAVLIAMFAAFLAIIQNSYGQFSDIRGFYGMHFADGQNQWPFSYHTLLGSTEERHPVEYPALTGLIMWLFSFFCICRLDGKSDVIDFNKNIIPFFYEFFVDYDKKFFILSVSERN